MILFGENHLFIFIISHILAYVCDIFADRKEATAKSDFLKKWKKILLLEKF